MCCSWNLANWNDYLPAVYVRVLLPSCNEGTCCWNCVCIKLYSNGIVQNAKENSPSSIVHSPKANDHLFPVELKDVTMVTVFESESEDTKASNEKGFLCFCENI